MTRRPRPRCDMRWRELPYTGKCYECGVKLAAAPTGTRPRWCPKCRVKRKRDRHLARLQAQRAWRGLRPHEIVTDARLKLDDRRRRPKARHLLFLKGCVDCGESFRGGHRAVRCLVCRVPYQRKLNHARYVRRVARRAA